MPNVSEEFLGSNGLIYYGTTLLFVDSWTANISIDNIDITNISIYDVASALPPQEDADGNTGVSVLPFPNNLPNSNKPFKKKSNNNKFRKYSQYMAPRLFIDGGLRQAKITATGLCATYNIDTEENYMPRVGNYVYMHFSNSVEEAQTLFEFRYTLITEVTYEYQTKNYQRWSMVAIATGDFDIFPGDEPV